MTKFTLNPFYLTTRSSILSNATKLTHDQVVPRLSDVNLEHKLSDAVLNARYCSPLILLSGNVLSAKGKTDHIMRRLVSEEDNYELGVRAVLASPDLIGPIFTKEDFDIYAMSEIKNSNLESLEERPVMYTDHGSPRALLFDPSDKYFSAIRGFYRLPEDLFLPLE